MKKMNKVVDFVKNHKKEILIATAASAVGVAGGIVGYKCHLSKDNLRLIKSASQFGKDAEGGTTLSHSIKLFLDRSDSVYPVTPHVDKTLAGTVGQEMLSVLEERGVKSTAKVSGIMVGIVND